MFFDFAGVPCRLFEGRVIVIGIVLRAALFYHAENARPVFVERFREILAVGARIGGIFQFVEALCDLQRIGGGDVVFFRRLALQRRQGVRQRRLRQRALFLKVRDAAYLAGELFFKLGDGPAVDDAPLFVELLLVFFRLPGGGKFPVFDDAACLDVCLLYTSPSPRD